MHCYCTLIDGDIQARRKRILPWDDLLLFNLYHIARGGSREGGGYGGFGGPPNFIKRKKRCACVHKTPHFSTQQLPGPPPPFRNHVSAPETVRGTGSIHHMSVSIRLARNWGYSTGSSRNAGTPYFICITIYITRNESRVSTFSTFQPRFSGLSASEFSFTAPYPWEFQTTAL